MRTHLLLGVVVMLTLGCGSEKIAPVSGVVMLNEKPLVGATVIFTPVKENSQSTKAPTTSSGITNEKGEYTLKTSTGVDGALVGKHSVSIVRTDPRNVDRDKRPVRGAPTPDAAPIPARYNEKTELTCEVPASGKTDASFSLKSP
jgi:hypothetical protein